MVCIGIPRKTDAKVREDQVWRCVLCSEVWRRGEGIRCCNSLGWLVMGGVSGRAICREIVGRRCMHAVTPKVGVAKPVMCSGQWGGEGSRGEIGCQSMRLPSVECGVNEPLMGQRHVQKLFN